jgi:sulfur carrier protein
MKELAPFTISVNGSETTTDAASLALLIAELGHTGEGVATALNGTFVALGDRARTQIKPGDSVEIVSVREGG